jgi:hypothetical protein
MSGISGISTHSVTPSLRAELPVLRSIEQLSQQEPRLYRNTSFIYHGCDKRLGEVVTKLLTWLNYSIAIHFQTKIKKKWKNERKNINIGLEVLVVIFQVRSLTGG